jgi:hypothetical protein
MAKNDISLHKILELTCHINFIKKKKLLNAMNHFCIYISRLIL